MNPYILYKNLVKQNVDILWQGTGSISEQAHTRTHTHAHAQSFYSSLDFVQDNLGKQVPEETFTHSHLSWSSIVLYLLHQSNKIQGILPVQFMHLIVFFHNLFPSFLWSTSSRGTLHFILHTSPNHCLLFVTCPYHRNLFCCSTELMSSNPSLSLNLLLGTLSCSFKLHIHLTILISACWHATSFSFLTGQVSLPCNILLRT